MSKLDLPSMPGAIQGVCTVPVVLPIEKNPVDGCSLKKFRESTMLVPPMHVVFRRGDIFASAHIPDTEYTSNGEVTPCLLGVSLDMIPFNEEMCGGWSINNDAYTERVSRGLRSFAVAVSGLVPIAVPSSILQNATLGDPLYASPERQNMQYFCNPYLRGCSFGVGVRPRGGRMIGTIVGLGGEGENHCLVLLQIERT